MLKGYFEAFENDRDFRSRTGRKAFWRASIPDVIILALLVAGFFLFTDFRIIFFITGILYLAVTLTSRLALWTRRLHDVGLKGTYAFIVFFPILGILALWFIFMSDSQPKDNDFGKYVKEPEKKKDKKKKK